MSVENGASNCSMSSPEDDELAIYGRAGGNGSSHAEPNGFDLTGEYASCQHTCMYCGQAYYGEESDPRCPHCSTYETGDGGGWGDHSTCIEGDSDSLSCDINATIGRLHSSISNQFASPFSVEQNLLDSYNDLSYLDQLINSYRSQIGSDVLYRRWRKDYNKIQREINNFSNKYKRR